MIEPQLLYQDIASSNTVKEDQTTKSRFELEVVFSYQTVILIANKLILKKSLKTGLCLKNNASAVLLFHCSKYSSLFKTDQPLKSATFLRFC